jgi:hypothetical protein
VTFMSYRKIHISVFLRETMQKDVQKMIGDVDALPGFIGGISRNRYSRTVPRWRWAGLSGAADRQQIVWTDIWLSTAN